MRQRTNPVLWEGRAQGSPSAVWRSAFVCRASVLTLNYYPATRTAAFVCQSSVNCKDRVRTVLAGDKILHFFSTNISANSPIYFCIDIFLENWGEVVEGFSPILIIALALFIFKKKRIFRACFFPRDNYCNFELFIILIKMPSPVTAACQFLSTWS